MCNCKMYTQNELTDAFRAAIEDRAEWFYRLLKAAQELGVEPEKIAEKAITDFGIKKGKNLGECPTAKEFAEGILSGHPNKAFAMEEVKIDEDRSEIKFRYCALVEAWKKLGCTPEEIEELCRLASFGDFGMVSVFPHLNLEFKELLSKGDDCCHMVITKK